MEHGEKVLDTVAIQIFKNGHLVLSYLKNVWIWNWVLFEFGLNWK